MLLLRGATSGSNNTSAGHRFQYMLLLRGATKLIYSFSFRSRRFNTCSSCEEQLNTGDGTLSRFCFNTCSSCEEQLGQKFLRLKHAGFNTCSSCEEQLKISPGWNVTGVSIHAPLARSNTSGTGIEVVHDVSIHAPLARSNTRL